MERTTVRTRTRTVAERIPGFHPDTPKRNVVVSLVYLHISLTALSLPGML